MLNLIFMNKHINVEKSAFTFIELMITVVVIAIISTISVIAFNGTRIQQRDSQRLLDIKQVALGLERYKNLNGDLPDCSSNLICDYDSNNSWESCLGQHLKPFIGNIPIDPGNIANIGYCYQNEPDTTTGISQVSLIYYIENNNPSVSYFGEIQDFSNSNGLSKYKVIIQPYRTAE